MDIEQSIPLFPYEEIPGILATIRRCATRLSKRDDTEKEDHITDRLFRLLRKSREFRSSPFSLHREFQVFHGAEQPGMYSGHLGSVGHTGRIDINFVCPPGDESYFAIEAKRLHVAFPSGWKSLVNEYVIGAQGMMCFISGKYSAAQKAAAMLGYVFDDDIAGARNAIEKKIIEHALELKLAEPYQVVTSTNSPGDTLVDETSHCLDARIFTIYHLLVQV